MAIEDDVLVIGGGLAGAVAALSAADRAERVRLVSYKQSTLRQASGLIDVLGYRPWADGDDADEPVVDPIAALEAVPDGHPYERIGPGSIREALAFFDAVTERAYAGAHTDANALVPTQGGTVKPTARYPRSSAAGLASDPRDVLFVGFETIPAFDAPLAAEHLHETGAPFESHGVTIEFPGALRDDATVTRYAHLLDRDERVETGGGTDSVRAALANAVRPLLETADAARVGFPAVLGATSPDAVRDELAERLGVDVFEVPMGPPSLPGIRLENLLYAAMKEAGVRITTGVPVVDYDVDESAGSGPARIDRVLVDREGRRAPYRADQYVLATGDLIGKGIRSSRERVTESIFDCHVAHPEDRYDWFDDAAFGDHPFARFGLDVDRRLVPLDRRGEREYSNVRAAGAILGGYDYAAEKSGAGVSIATGYVAGRAASEEVES